MPRLKLLLAAPAAAALFAAAPAAAQGPCGETYTVAAGDTLYRIAQRCRTSVGALMRANPSIRSADRIEVGQRLAIPGAARRPDQRRAPEQARRGPPPCPPPAPPQRPDRPDRGDEVRQITGVITREGVECPALRTDRGELYTLAGDIEQFGPGDRVTVRGPIAEVSFCQQGTTIEVRDIRAAGWRR